MQHIAVCTSCHISLLGGELAVRSTASTIEFQIVHHPVCTERVLATDKCRQSARRRLHLIRPCNYQKILCIYKFFIQLHFNLFVFLIK